VNGYDHGKAEESAQRIKKARNQEEAQGR